MTIAGRIDELGAIYDSVETRVQGARHAHRAGFAGRIERVAAERILPELAARQTNRVDLAVRARVVFRNCYVRGANQTFTALRVDDLRAERDRMRAVHGQRCPGDEASH